MDEQAVQKFWEEHACGDAQVGGLRVALPMATTKDSLRITTASVTRTSATCLACIDALNVADKKVLEIGLGEGAESERLIRAGSTLVRRRPDGRIGGKGPDPADYERPTPR